MGCASELEGVLLCIKNLANKIKLPCPQCPYTLGQVHTVVNPCPQCRMNGFKTYEQFKKELAGKLTMGV